MELKQFQKDALAALRSFLERARVEGPAAAFAALAPRVPNAPAVLPVYKPIPGLEAAPCVCLRLPTGGGKTILAAHGIRTAAAAWLDRDYPLTLWLVPSRTIKEQTLEALKKSGHPYRQALDDAFGGKVRVFDIADVTQLRPADLTERACIVVGTLQTGRVSETESRAIYAHNEHFEPHFKGALPADRPFERHAEGPWRGQVKFSFANLLMLHQPLVITDEAHNADSPLTYEMYRRYNPAAVIELTATPDYAHSNVLYRVSAFELKKENLIKLPVLLTEHSSWEATVNAALTTRRQLAEAARGESDPVRPLILFQAENKNLAVTAEVLKRHLIEQEGVAEAAIAVVTGDQRELDDVNLFDPNCPIECIITVQALKEGWDCSFAYVFCSVANIGSATAVEQLLGRVLRMPYAKRRTAEALNRAYAHVCSPTFAAAAKALRDRMVDRMGFEEEEAEEVIRQLARQPDERGWTDLPLFQPARLVLREPPATTGWGTADRDAVSVRRVDAERVEVVVRAAVTDACADGLLAALPAAERAPVAQALAPFRRSAGAPPERRIVVPRLCVVYQDELRLVEAELLEEAGGWDLLHSSTDLPGFAYAEESRTFTLDLAGRRLVLGTDSAAQATLPGTETPLTVLDVVRFLDRNISHPDIRQPVMYEWLRRIVDGLLTRRGFTLSLLDRAKFVLRRVVETHLRACRAAARGRGVQTLLFAPGARPTSDAAHHFAFDPNPLAYPAPSYDRGWKPRAHLYPHVALFDSEEEKACAMQLDMLPQVDVWVRNLDQKPDHAFWLPTASDRFYPDFVARLLDGRLLVADYKGGDRASNDDTREKAMFGQFWEQADPERHIFMMLTEKDGQGRDIRAQLLARLDRVGGG